MTEKTATPTEAEMSALRRDAAQNVTHAHEALQGNLDALAEWRRQQVPSSDK